MKYRISKYDTVTGQATIIETEDIGRVNQEFEEAKFVGAMMVDLDTKTPIRSPQESKRGNIVRYEPVAGG